MRTGVIDVGSSAVKFGVYDIGPEVTLIREGDPVATSLGRGLAPGGPLDPDARRKTREMVREFTAAIHALDARPALLIATEAVRRTNDREAFLAELREDTGGEAEVRCISFEEEARWAFESARVTLGPLGGETLVVDPGGSSNDYALGSDAGAAKLFSLPFGMNDFMDVVDPRARDGVVTAADRTALTEAGRARYGALKDELEDLPARLVAGSGAAIALAAMKIGSTAADRETRSREGHGVSIGRKDLAAAVECLADLTSSERQAAHSCLSASRAPIVVHGALMYDAMLAVLGLDELTVNGFGIKLGAALSLR